MARGIDVSELNGFVDWNAVKDAGIEFAIIRLGYGNQHLDENFYANINGAIDAELKVGVYYYSYALCVSMAIIEARYVIRVLSDAGLTPDKLPMGVWFDMEDADGYKDDNGMPDDSTITAMCKSFVDILRNHGYQHTGIYASLAWLEDKINMIELNDVPVWCAEWGNECDWGGAEIWQYTDSLEVGGSVFDGDWQMEAEE